jgi:hypothetical protein
MLDRTQKLLRRVWVFRNSDSVYQVFGNNGVEMGQIEQAR